MPSSLDVSILQTLSANLEAKRVKKMLRSMIPRWQLPWMKMEMNDLFNVGHNVITVNPWFRLFLDKRMNRYEVHDTHPSVHPHHTLLKKIMNEDGSYRYPTTRDVQELREMVWRANKMTSDQVHNELEQVEEARQRKWRADSDWSEFLLREDLKWVGRDIVPSTRWDARSLRREDLVRHTQSISRARA